MVDNCLVEVLLSEWLTIQSMWLDIGNDVVIEKFGKGLCVRLGHSCIFVLQVGKTGKELDEFVATERVRRVFLMCLNFKVGSDE